MSFRTIKDMDFNGKKVILRADLDVPLENGKILDDTRLKHAVPTIKRLIERGAKQVIIMGHLHRPGGKFVKELCMNPVAKILSKLLEENVVKLNDCIDIEIPNDRIILLENLRFHPEEKENYEFFAKKLASFADIYVNDAFANCHRAHASMSRITEFLPSCAGLSLETELSSLGKALSEPKRPFVAIIGGAKISGKIGVINNLLKKVDKLLLGGAMIFTFYKAQNLEIGKSLFEPEKVDLAKFIMHNEKLVLPSDVVVADKKEAGANIKTVDSSKIPNDLFGLDIGEISIREFQDILKDAGTVIWNGPMGLFEISEFAEGTNEIAKFLSELDATVIIGGGDITAAIKKLGLEKKITHISTGGGSTLELLEGKELPAVIALEDNKKRF